MAATSTFSRRSPLRARASSNRTRGVSQLRDDSSMCRTTTLSGGNHPTGRSSSSRPPGPRGQRLWAYRYRLDGRGSPRIQRDGYASVDDAREALQRALTAAQRRKGRARMTLADLAEEYLAQHDGEPENGQAALAAHQVNRSVRLDAA